MDSDAVEKNVIDVVVPVFREVFEDEAMVVRRELSAHDVEAWDSLNHITLVVELELKTGIQFTTDELAAMVNVGDMIDCHIRKGYTGET